MVLALTRARWPATVPGAHRPGRARRGEPSRSARGRRAFHTRCAHAARPERLLPKSFDARPRSRPPSSAQALAGARGARKTRRKGSIAPRALREQRRAPG